MHERSKPPKCIHNSIVRAMAFTICFIHNIETLEQQKSFRVHTTLLASMCHAIKLAMTFLARALKKNIFFDVDIVV